MVSWTAAKFSFKGAKDAAVWFINRRNRVKHGKQSLRRLNLQNRGLANIDISKKNLKGFKRIARKYGVDFALRKDSTLDPPKWCLFFKAQDADLLTAALSEFTRKLIKKSKDKPSAAADLAKYAELAKTNVIAKIKNKGLSGPEL
jgi:hypothetical protein